MTNVLILGKTLMGQGICLGGMRLDTGESIRLLPPDDRYYARDQLATPEKVGDIWDYSLRTIPKSKLLAPHTENIRARRKLKVKQLSKSDLRQFVVEHFNPPTVCPEELFDGLLHFSQYGRAYVHPNNVPRYSTGIWRFRKSLSIYRGYYPPQTRYFLQRDDEHLDIKYVGFEKPLWKIPPGTLLRFSLTQWYKGGYWLQLSGWFL